MNFTEDIMGSNIIVSGPKPMAQDVKIVEFPGAQLYPADYGQTQRAHA